ncbi:hypothetical protein G1C96_0976 [Bifidobacterium sp. DSM 109958]|uniref:DUF262 domain-containing protein n=1 Tax=Bifidobacterium moraviense TaxID=2675323 RepID=A0A7Y0HYG9_9BIFI|nr:DUF262 domain-containing protein [Bifidobacterium sp. DSM 109958]NMN00397.1 hypothetical protein [Bifidobacterium sp. DSM 109958]
MAINAQELTLSKVFTPDFRLTIPSFQRAYVWKVQNILQLVEDLEQACKTPGIPYFLGSLILVREEDRRFSVIDGQQRLISLSIIIAALRDHEQDADWMEKLDGLLMEHGDKLRGIEHEPRLTLRERDAAFFREYVQEGNLEPLFDLNEDDLPTGAQRNIFRNTRAVYDALDNLDADERHHLASYLVNGVTLVIVTTDDLDGAHRIFDVMNMRGLPLTAADVFKSHVAAALSPTQLDAYAARWDDIMDPLGDDSPVIERFFTALTVILTRDRARGNLIDDFTTRVLRPYLDDGKAAAFIDDVLAPYSMAWRVIERPSAATALPGNVTDRLEALNDYGSDEWKPVAMWALVHSFRGLGDPDASPFAPADTAQADTPQRARHGSHAGAGGTADLGAHDLQRLDDVLAALERVTGVATLTRMSAYDRQALPVNAVRGLDKGLALRQISSLNVGSRERNAALIRLHGNFQGEDDLARLLLVRANEQLTGRRLARPRRLCVLPIMPLDIAHAASFSGWSQDDHDRWLPRLGNMVLAQGDRKQLDSLSEYADRRERITLKKDSQRFPLTRQLNDFGACTPEMLAHRQETTIRLIAEYWGIRYDERHTDLTEKTPEELDPASATARPQRGSKRVTISQVIAAGLLIPGEKLVWERPRKGERWFATVTENGRFRLDDGSEYPTPTAAARAAAGGRRSGGLEVWKRVSDGRSLSDIWQTYRRGAA